MIIKVDHTGINYELNDGQTISIGRKGAGADLEIDDQSISRKHAQVKLEGRNVHIMDTKSTNGVLINGNKITPEQWYAVANGDQVSILGYLLKFQPVNEPQEIKLKVEDKLKPEMKPEPKPEPKPQPQEKKQGAEDLNKKFDSLLNLKLPIRIGRADDNDIVLPDKAPDDRTVSRKHAEIYFEGGRYWVKDLGSTNGTFLNDTRLEPNQPKILEDKDIVLIHLHCFSLIDGYRDLREEVAIRAEGIGKVYANKFVGLNPMSVEIPYKKIVALMGPSGCGKSTLLKALNGDNPATSGNIYIHGLSLRENYQLLKRKIGYVPQDDIIHKELKVEETLYMAAKLRLPDDTSDAEISKRITEVLASLNFDDEIRHKEVGGLSGGQRKRVCIAVELLSRPTILFLDEPTSPLDPESIDEFLKSLKELAANGTTIVMVTHKPEDLLYADKIIFMAIKGYFVYYGERNGLLEKFKASNILEIYKICGDDKKFDPKEYYIAPRGAITRREPEKMIADKQNNLLLQFYWLTLRYLKIKISDRYNMYLLLAQPFIIAGLVAVIFHSLNVQVMMLIAISAIWFGVSNSSKEIVGEFAIYKRERMFNLNIHTYILSKWVVLSLISLVQVVIFISIIHLRFHSDEALGSYSQNIAYMFYTASSATLFGLFLSAYFTTTEKVLTVVPIALMPQIMLAGVVEHLRSVKVDALSYFTLGRWGTEGFLRIQNNKITTPTTTAPFKAPALDELYYNDTLTSHGGAFVNAFNSMGANIMAILILSAAMYALTYYSLKKKDTI
ncbi:MAG: FHA domain-containing protein [Bacteroidetes bacterium]|jgi:ABC-type multidrug transport system ATPase subunit/pSer/pThr/pTyr-binding forkhead associated (FHA) protein|nr:FHA domain-containing protein [Bacteroidota bacterium]